MFYQDTLCQENKYVHREGLQYFNTCFILQFYKSKSEALPLGNVGERILEV